MQQQYASVLKCTLFIYYLFFPCLSVFHCPHYCSIWPIILPPLYFSPSFSQYLTLSSSLCLSLSQGLVTALYVRHLIKVMPNKTVLPARRCSHVCVHMCTVCKSQAGCVPAETARLKASPSRANAYASPFRLGYECGSPSNALQF